MARTQRAAGASRSERFITFYSPVLELSVTSFLPEQTETLRQLSDLWRDTPFVLIGANALALQIDLEWRQTNDLDFVISVALEDYPAGLAALPGWHRRREG